MSRTVLAITLVVVAIINLSYIYAEKNKEPDVTIHYPNGDSVDCYLRETQSDEQEPSR